MRWEVRQGDALDQLREMPAGSVQCCVTSPPYFGLRDYRIDGQIGLEASPDEFIGRLVEVFREVRRVLRDDGTLWLNIGDSYAGYHGNARASDGPTPSDKPGYHENMRQSSVRGEVKQKDLLMIPAQLALALRADGWHLRSEIVWSKPNPMPESVTDRPTSAHEKLFLLAKSPRYFYDADAIREGDSGHASGNGFAGRQDHRLSGGLAVGGTVEQWQPGAGRNKRNVWEIATHPYPDAHFATFPPKLVEPCVLAGSSPRACGECGAPWRRVVKRTPATVLSPASGYGHGAGHNDGNRSMLVGASSETIGWGPSCEHQDDTGHSVILDPFAGAGTTGLVALRHDRSFIGIELNASYAEMARQRIRDDAPLLNAASEVAA